MVGGGVPAGRFSTWPHPAGWGGGGGAGASWRQCPRCLAPAAARAAERNRQSNSQSKRRPLSFDGSGRWRGGHSSARWHSPARLPATRGAGGRRRRSRSTSPRPPVVRSHHDEQAAKRVITPAAVPGRGRSGLGRRCDESVRTRLRRRQRIAPPLMLQRDRALQLEQQFEHVTGIAGALARFVDELTVGVVLDTDGRALHLNRCAETDRARRRAAARSQRAADDELARQCGGAQRPDRRRAARDRAGRRRHCGVPRRGGHSAYCVLEPHSRRQRRSSAARCC